MISPQKLLVVQTPLTNGPQHEVATALTAEEGGKPIKQVNGHGDPKSRLCTPPGGTGT